VRTRLASLALGLLVLAATFFLTSQRSPQAAVSTTTMDRPPPPIWSSEIDPRPIMEMLRRRVPREIPIYALRNVAPFQVPLVWAPAPEVFDPLGKPNETGAIHPTEIDTSALPADLGRMTIRVATLYGRKHSNLLLDRPFLYLHPSPGVRVEVHVYPTPKLSVRGIVRAWIKQHLAPFTQPDPPSPERTHQA
jgi:hypothetical protein